MAANKKPDSLTGPSTCDETSGCCSMDRRMFVKLGGAGLAAWATAGVSFAAAGPFSQQDTLDHFVPVDKKLQPDWVKSLFERGESTWYAGDDLRTIGMPVGGLCAGQVYLTGDGRLVYWGIFNQRINTGYGSLNYKVGREPTEMVEDNKQIIPAPDVDQGFVLKVTTSQAAQVRSLDRVGFPRVRFCGEYPLGYVNYAADDCPLQVQLEAFSPFIPLNAEDSSLPATILNFTVKNTSSETVEATLAGWLQNAALHYSKDRCAQTHVRVNSVTSTDELTTILLGTRKAKLSDAAVRPPVVFADFEGGSYGQWKVEGEAFGEAPATGTLPQQQPVVGFRGKGLVNTYLGGNDRLQGKLVSPAFTIERPFISFLIGGGPDNRTAIRLIVDGKAVATASGKQNEQLIPCNWNVAQLAGKSAHLEIVDESPEGWGHINLDQIEFRDTPMVDLVEDASQLPDFGTMALSVLKCKSPLISLAVPEAASPTQMLEGDQLADEKLAERRLDQRHRGALGTQWKLKPGETANITFVVAWHMPNMYFRNELVRNQYAGRFSNAAEVAAYVAANEALLTSQTRLWHDTYYDSTLPHWLLDRLHSTLCNLATETCQWWENGRFWAFEGCGCCHGTCGHVWNYEHAMARLFPQLERSVREMQDFAPGVGFIPETGEIRFRGEDWELWAGDSQGGYILKAYREHQLTGDNGFLTRNWPHIRKAVQFLFDQDGNADGLLEGRQHQTYDENYYGPNTMVGSLYLGALRAAEEMAKEMGDEPFAQQCREIFERGRENSVKQLFNGEYYVQKVDLEQHPDWQYADGCLADQMFGQGWAHQVDLGYLYPRDTVTRSLESIWKYCWAPDVKLQNEHHAPERWFAYPGEAGLFTCTWPKSKHLGPKSTRYRDEIWTGIEYQVANHMAYEGMLTEALAICRAVHDRYHPSKHNPFNEIECGDHYARALASWGVLLGLAGFEYHGPQRHIGFLPKITPEQFRCVFSTFDGWGTYDQRRDNDQQLHTMEVKWGEVALRSVTLQLPAGKAAKSIAVIGPAGPVQFTVTEEGEKARLELTNELVIPAGKQLRVEMTS